MKRLLLRRVRSLRILTLCLFRFLQVVRLILPWRTRPQSLGTTSFRLLPRTVSSQVKLLTSILESPTDRQETNLYNSGDIGLAAWPKIRVDLDTNGLLLESPTQKIFNVTETSRQPANEFALVNPVFEARCA
jgi:hypothetical protein